MKNGFGLLLFGILGLGLLYVFTKSTSSNLGTRSNEPIQLQLKPARRYQNSETWDITWNEDGLPSKVTIHRDAVQT